MFQYAVPEKNIDPTLKLLEERMFNPNFTMDAFTRIQKQMLEGFKQAKSQPSAIANNLFDKINYGAGNILGMSEDGTESSIKRLTVNDIQDYYDSYMTSRDAKVVIVGDISQNEILPKLSFLNKLPNKRSAFPNPVWHPR